MKINQFSDEELKNMLLEGKLDTLISDSKKRNAFIGLDDEIKKRISDIVKNPGNMSKVEIEKLKRNWAGGDLN